MVIVYKTDRLYNGSMAKSGEGVRLISERCEGSNPSAPTCSKHNEAQVLYDKRWKCKSCNREYQAKWFGENQKIQLARVKKNRERAQKAAWNFAWDYKSQNPCVDCGENDPIVLEFDHVQEKFFGIATAVANGMRIEKIAEELAKCEIRCANCHRRKTAKQLGWYKKHGLQM